MTDAFTGTSNVEWGPYENAAAISPHASNALAAVTRGIYVGGAGDVVVRLQSAAGDVTFKAPPVGTILPIRATHVRDSSTATLMIALW